MYVLYIVKAQAAPKNQTLKLSLPYEAIPCTILCHTAQTSFLRRDFWYLNRAASSPRALWTRLHPFPLANVSYTYCMSTRIVYALHCACKTNFQFDFWPKRAAFWHFVNTEQILIVPPTRPESAVAHESNSVCISRPNVINLRLSMEYFWLPTLPPGGKLTIVSSFAVWLW